MKVQRTFSDELKHQYRNGGMHIKLIFVNVLVFALIHLLLVFGKLAQNDQLDWLVSKLFIMPTDPSELILAPWTLITSIFAHIDFMHFILNMLLLYFAGSAFRMFFSDQRMLTVYLLGGLSGNLAEILAHLGLPHLFGASYVLGASGANMAIFLGLAFYRPFMPVNLFGVFRIQIIYLGLIYLIADFIRLGTNDGVAHFGHIGGALIGFLAARRGDHPNHFMSSIDRFFASFKRKITTFDSAAKRQKNQDPRRKTDEEYNMEAKDRQRKTDEILDKISKSGYESLSKAEKEFLFKQSRK